jgi:hypothetical protein
MKNGRFSSKKMAKGRFNSSSRASASIWEKSGFTVALSARLVVNPHRAVAPRLVSTSPSTMTPSSSASSVRTAVRVGTISRLRPGDTPSKPSISMAWHR